TALLTDTTTVTVCTSQLPYIWNGNPYTVAGQYRDTLASTTGGCDTIAVLNLSVTALLTYSTTVTVCTSQLPYIWNGNPYTIAGQYRDTLVSTTGGCDTIAVLNLSVTALLTDTTTVTVCTSQLPYIWNGNPYTVAGQYRDTLISTTGGCDTIAVLNLSVTALLTYSTTVTVCTSQLPYIWNGNPYTIAGQYRDTLVSTTGGCDTIAVLNLSVTALLTDTTTVTVCTSQLPYIWNGNPYTVAGQYRDTLISTTGGCDTIAVLNLSVTALLTYSTTVTVCTSQLPYIWNGNPYTIAGQYRDTLVSTTGGCDTIAVLNLSVTALLTDTTTVTVCTSQLPYIWNGNPYTIAGQYRDTLVSTTGGCDTIAVLNLTVTALLTDTTTVTVCTSQLPYIWNGNPYTVTGQYRDTLASTTGGCDTIAVLNLTVTAILTDTTTVTVCTSQLPYIWNGNPYTV